MSSGLHEPPALSYQFPPWVLSQIVCTPLRRQLVPKMKDSKSVFAEGENANNNAVSYHVHVLVKRFEVTNAITANSCAAFDKKHGTSIW